MTDFDLFWEHYPLKKAKGAARKKFQTLKKSKVLPDVNDLIKAIDNQKKEKSYLKSQNKFCPPWKHPSTWLNQECWGDVCILPPAVTRPTRKTHSIDNLQRAFNILTNLGQDKFESFCQQLGMSEHDRECVIMAAGGGVHRVNRLASGMLKEA